MTELSESLFERLRRRRLTVVSGKGGVGKSTVVAAMARALAADGARVLVVEPSGPHRLPRLLGAAGQPPEGQGQVAPGIWGLFLDPEIAMAAYMRSQVRVRLLAERIVRSKIYQRFIAAAPGLKELIVLGKVMMVYRGRHEVAGEAEFDHLILDAPATGHGVQLLRVPRLTIDTFGDSPLTREARRVQEMLEADDTFVDVVTLAEEMPVNEALELEETTRDLLRFQVGALIVNGLFPAIGAAAAAWDPGKLIADPRVAGAHHAATWCRSRCRMQQQHLQRASEATHASVERLPFIFTADEQEVVERLAEELRRPTTTSTASVIAEAS
jgi:energy-coupling factor transporter ATP-binding protein EcfA2